MVREISEIHFPDFEESQLNIFKHLQLQLQESQIRVQIMP